MAKLIGIIPTKEYSRETKSSNGTYIIKPNYGTRITEAGGIPLVISPVNDTVSEEVLDKFDAFVICGGFTSCEYHFQVVEHALKTGKKLLGICLGSQILNRYFLIQDFIKENNLNQSVWDIFNEEKSKHDNYLLERVENHFNKVVPGHEEDVKHPVNLVEGTMVQKLYGTNVINGASFHSFRIATPSPQVTICGRADDGTLEAVEYKDQCVGFQFHPEFDNKLMPVFNWLCE